MAAFFLFTTFLGTRVLPFLPIDVGTFFGEAGCFPNNCVELGCMVTDGIVEGCLVVS